MDERKESGEYYPGGRNVPGGGGTGGGGGTEAPKVPVTQVEQLPEEYRESDMRNKINQLCRIVSGGVAALALMVAARGAEVTVAGARKDALWNSDFVVTNVTAELGDLATTNQLEEAKGEAAALARAEIAGATNALAAAARGEIAGATNDLAGAVCEGIALATNSMEAATAAKLEGYAKKSWVESQGYSRGTNMTAYAEKSWVMEQGYADRGWVEGKGYLTGTNLNGYAEKSWVEGKRYLTGTNLNGYAKESWVQGRGYLVGTNLNGYAQKSWVEGKGYLTEGDGRAMVREYVRERVASEVMEMDGTTAHRLMAAGADEWIDGTGTVWQVRRAVAWNGEFATNFTDSGMVKAWEAESWYCTYHENTAVTGSWYLVANVNPSGTLQVTYAGEGLPGVDGAYALEATNVQLNGEETQPGQVTESGWYQINDGEGGMYFVSPLVTTVAVVRVTNAVDRIARASDAPPAVVVLTTNDVCNIVTNEVTEWTEWELVLPDELPQDQLEFWRELNQDQTLSGRIWLECDSVGNWMVYIGDMNVSDPLLLVEGGTRLVWTTGWSSLADWYDLSEGSTVATRTRITRNALRLARQSDIPTNTVTREEMEAAMDDQANYLRDLSTSLAAVSNEAQVVYRLFSGSNVICEVTNYNSRVNPPALSIMQLSESNTYFTVWAETNGLARTFNAATNDAAQRVEAATAALPATYAPRAWSRTTSGLGAEAPANTTWISTPTTVIAGGLEYAKVVHSGGALWVLSGNGMVDFTPNTNSYLRISAEDGTEIFSIEKSDTVTVGAYAEGITVDGNTVTIPVPVVSADHPVAYYRQTLDAGDWAESPGTWSGASGSWVFTRTFNPLPSSGFFRFTYEMPGKTLIKNSAAIDVSAGIMCTDGIHKVRPVYNNGNITWEVVQ